MVGAQARPAYYCYFFFAAAAAYSFIRGKSIFGFGSVSDSAYVPEGKTRCPGWLCSG